MSITEYEDYSRTSRAYDQTRIPIGIEVILGSFARGPKPLQAQKVLDAGCGTGNYLWALKEAIGSLVGLDQNEGMLEMAREKFQGYPRVEMVAGSLMELPFEEGTFDGVTCNQVLHHLFEDLDSAGDLERLDHVMTEFFRVLAMDSTLVINTASRKQVREGYWWAAFIPEAIDQICRRFPPIPRMMESMEKAGFEVTGTFVPTHGVLQGANYLNPEGPFDPAWRAGDSTWALVSSEELAKAHARLKKLIETQEMEAFLAEKERIRKEIGQTTFVVARKSS